MASLGNNKVAGHIFYTIGRVNFPTIVLSGIDGIRTSGTRIKAVLELCDHVYGMKGASIRYDDASLCTCWPSIELEWRTIEEATEAEKTSFFQDLRHILSLKEGCLLRLCGFFDGAPL